MEEDNVSVFRDFSVPDTADQSRHPLTGIYGIKKYALMAGQRVGGGNRAIRRNAIALADISVIDENAIPAQGPVGQQGRRLDRQPVDILDLNVVGLANTDTHDRNITVMGMKTGYKACLRAGAAGRHNQNLRVQFQFGNLLQNFLGTGDVAKRPDFVRTAPWNEIGPVSVFTKPVCHSLRFGVHIKARRAEFDGRPEHLVKQHIAGLFITDTGIGYAPFEQRMAFHAKLGGCGGRLPDMV